MPQFKDVDYLTDIAVGNSKTFVVPATADVGGIHIPTRIWSLLYGSILLTTTAGVGNRQIRFQVTDSADVVLYQDDAAGTVPASQTDVEHLVWASGDIAIPVGHLVLPAGFKIVISDLNDIDVLDTIKARLVVEEWIEKEI